MNELKPKNSKAILQNIELVFRTGNIEKLNKPTYQFVANMSGFIAHYDLGGFQNTYSDVSQLITGIAESVNSYVPEHAYYEKSYGKAYADSVQTIYDALPGLCATYSQQATQSSNDRATTALENVYALIGETLKRNDPELSRAMVQKLELAY